MASGKRNDKLAQQIQADLSDIFLKLPPSITQGMLATIVDCKVTPDLGLARVYISTIGPGKPQDFVAAIKENAKDIRMELAKKIRNDVRKIPELAFYTDEGAERSQKMNDLLDNLDIKKDNES